jgi:hypothetical protein
MPTPHTRSEAISPLTTPVEIDREILVRLRPAAARRDTTIPRLIGDLLEAIAENNLADAVLGGE